MSEQPTLLKIESLTLRFSSLTALQSIDCHVRQGDITAIIGPNGAGKIGLLY